MSGLNIPSSEQNIDFSIYAWNIILHLSHIKAKFCEEPIIIYVVQINVNLLDPQ